MTDRDSQPEPTDVTSQARSPLPDDGRVEPITAQEIDDAVDAFDAAFPDLAGLLDAEPT